MSRLRLTYSAACKTQVRLNSLEGIDLVPAAAATYPMHPVPVVHWTKEAADTLPEVFARRRDSGRTLPTAERAPASCSEHDNHHRPHSNRGDRPPPGVRLPAAAGSTRT